MLQEVLYIQYNVSSSGTVAHKPVPILYFYYSQTFTPHKLKNSEHQEIIMICTMRDNEFLLQQCLEHWWFDIWQSYFPLCFSQRSTEHSEEDTTSADENIFMCRNSFFVFSYQEVNVTGHLIAPHVAVTKLKVSTRLPIVND